MQRHVTRPREAEAALVPFTDFTPLEDGKQKAGGVEGEAVPAVVAIEAFVDGDDAQPLPMTVGRQAEVSGGCCGGWPMGALFLTWFTKFLVARLLRA